MSTYGPGYGYGPPVVPSEPGSGVRITAAILLLCTSVLATVAGLLPLWTQGGPGTGSVYTAWLATDAATGAVDDKYIPLDGWAITLGTVVGIAAGVVLLVTRRRESSTAKALGVGAAALLVGVIVELLLTLLTTAQFYSRVDAGGSEFVTNVGTWLELVAMVVALAAGVLLLLPIGAGSRPLAPYTGGPTYGASGPPPYVGGASPFDPPGPPTPGGPSFGPPPHPAG